MKGKKAIFLDRDGVVNKEIGRYIVNEQEFEILPSLIDNLALFRQKGYLIIIISNQGGISKKLYTADDVWVMHNKLINLLSSKNVEITAFYFCPHHQSVTNCLCRKPNSLLLEKAIARFHIDVSQSFFIGDAPRDVDAAKKVNLSAIHVASNASLDKIQHLIP